MDAGRKILMKTFQRGQMYHYTDPTPEEFAIALKEGYMFEKRAALTHDEILVELRQTVEKISPIDVANAFLYSLSTRKLEYRSPMGSYWLAKAIPPHKQTGEVVCACCDWWQGWADFTDSPAYVVAKPHHTPENYMNFCRYRGWWQTDAQYILFDLQQFLLMPKVVPLPEDYRMLKDILDAVKEVPPQKKAGAYRELLTKKKVMPCNKDEIGMLINIMGICGLLSTAEHPCPDVEFRGSKGLDSQETRSYIAYPASYWHASDGINEERFLKVFGFPFQTIGDQ